VIRWAGARLHNNAQNHSERKTEMLEMNKVMLIGVASMLYMLDVIFGG